MRSCETSGRERARDKTQWLVRGALGRWRWSPVPSACGGHCWHITQTSLPWSLRGLKVARAPCSLTLPTVRIAHPLSSRMPSISCRATTALSRVPTSCRILCAGDLPTPGWCCSDRLTCLLPARCTVLSCAAGFVMLYSPLVFAQSTNVALRHHIESTTILPCTIRPVDRTFVLQL